MSACKHQPRSTRRLWVDIDSHSNCKSYLITMTVDDCFTHVWPSVKPNTTRSSQTNVKTMTMCSHWVTYTHRVVQISRILALSQTSPNAVRPRLVHDVVCLFTLSFAGTFVAAYRGRSGRVNLRGWLHTETVFICLYTLPLSQTATTVM